MTDDFVPLGKICQSHGVRGEVKILSYTTPAESIFSYALSDEHGNKMLLAKTGTQPDWFVCKIAGIDDRNAAQALKNKEIGVARSMLPLPEEGTILASDLIGCAVYDMQKLPIGTVRQVANYGASDILIIDTMDGELMLPFTERFIPQQDLKSRVLICDMPDIMAASSHNNKTL